MSTSRNTTQLENARRHINSFRAARGLPENDVLDLENLNLLDLSSALKLTSSQLYPEIHHFIWEIVQNTDDAEYNSKPPELRIILTNNTLYAWSNQTGFTKSDVDSLCGIGRSSKTSKPDTIGEKGIGFKSLFTVANKVVIHSEPYHFKFDTTSSLGNLGMIVPTWTNEPAGVVAENFTIPVEGTTLVLHLKTETDVGTLRSEFEKLNVDFLLFCRRLKKVTTSLYSGSQPFWRTAELCGGSSDNVSLYITSSTRLHGVNVNFRLFSHTLTGMPEQSERPKQTASTIRLAFPLYDNWGDLYNCSTFAFLPMKPFGFNFPIHANFILTANRGEVVHANPWNIALRKGLINLIRDAVVWFATSNGSPAKFKWPYFVRSLFNVHDIFFKPLAKDVCDILKRTPLLLTELDPVAQFQEPTNAFCVGREFRSHAGDGKLILGSQSLASRTIRQDYPSEILSTLERLGVKHFKHEDFLEELKNMISKEKDLYRLMPLEWHAAVAQRLHNSRHTVPNAFAIMKTLEMIPLSTGEWVNAHASHVLLPGQDSPTIPSGLKVRMVDPSACTDGTRRLLFEWLGLKSCNQSEICDLILKDHRNNAHNPNVGNVEQVRYLFSAKYKPRHDDIFHFHDEELSNLSRTHRLLIPFGLIGKEMREMFSTAIPGVDGVRWLHADYCSATDPKKLESFVRWLTTWPNIGNWPLIHQNYSISPAMSYLLVKKGSKVMLRHLLWRTKNGQSIATENDSWCQVVGKQLVETNKGLHPLHCTALPWLQDLSEGAVPIVELDRPDDPQWSFLAAFGVMTTPNAQFLLQKLRHLKNSDQLNLATTLVVNVYSQLGACIGEDALIKTAFETENLIYTPQSVWVKSSACRWSTRYTCKLFYILGKQYPRSASLFKNILDIQPTDLADLIKEIELWITETESSINCRHRLDCAYQLTCGYKLLQELNRTLGAKSATPHQVAQLKELRVFPVSDQPAIASLRLAASTDSFWIGDIPWLQNIFDGKLPLLLRSSAQQVKRLDKVFQVLGMDNKRLTMTASCEFTSQKSGGQADLAFTAFLKRKIPYMTGILTDVEEPKPNLKPLLDQLKNLQVQRVSGIKVRRFVVRDGTRIYGEDEEGEICLQANSSGLIINLDPELREPDVFGLLEEHLSNYWDLQPKSRELLFKILASSSEKRYTEAFERAGISLEKVSRCASEGATAESEGENEDVKTDPASKAILELTFPRPGGSRAHRPSTSVDQAHVICISDDSDEADFPSNFSQQVRKTPEYAKSRKPDESEHRTGAQNHSRYPRHPKSTESAQMSPSTQESSTLARNIVQRILNASASDMTKSQYQIFQNTTGITGARSVRRTGDNEDATMLDDPAPSLTQTSIDLISIDAQQRRVTRTRSQDSADRINTTPSPVNLTEFSANTPHRILSHDSSEKPNPSQTVHRGIQSPSSARKKRKYNADEVGTQGEGVTHEIGRAGEYLVFNFLSRTLGASFKTVHWTSRNRNHFFPAESFREFEGDFADFTFKDEDGKLSDYLAAAVPGYQPPPSSKATYHLEVKCTLEGLDADAILSNNQIRLAKGFSKWGKQADTTQDDVYVLVRVCDLEKDDQLSPKLCFFPDPWDLICRGKLLIEGENGIYVRPAQTSKTT